MSPPSPTPPLLALPLELRYTIYSYLCPPSPRSYPYTPPSPITSVTHRGPPLSLLQTCRPILTELTTYYFALATFRFVAQSFNINLTGEWSPASMCVVRKARKVELLLLPGTMKAGVPGARARAEQRWLEEQVRLLRDEAKQLQVVIVSVRNVSWDHSCSVRLEMEALLKPLEVLKGRVEFRAGEVMGPSAVEGEMREQLESVLRRLNT